MTSRVEQHLSKTNLYIKGLSSSTSDNDLFEMCSRFGPITSAKAIIDKATGQCKGYGFVEFKLPESADTAVKELTKNKILAQMAKLTSLHPTHQHSHNHNNNHLHHHHQHHNNTHSMHHNPHYMNNNNNHHNNQHQGQHHFSHNLNGHNSHNNNNNHANSTSSNSSNNNTSSNNGNSDAMSNSGSQHNSFSNNADFTNLYLANLPQNMTEFQLQQVLSAFGTVLSTRILRDSSDNPKGVGFARMESREICEKIIEQLNNRPYKQFAQPFIVKFADSGNKKRHHQHQHHHHNHTSHHHHNKQYHKLNQDDVRWRDAGGSSNNAIESGNVDNYEHNKMQHSNPLSDLAVMNSMNYPRMPGFPPSIPAGATYPGPLAPPTSVPQWIHHSPTGQPYVIPRQVMQTGGIEPSNQAAAAAAQYYGHISQLTSQMQGLQLAGHLGTSVGGYMHPQQWPPHPLWGHPIPMHSQQHSVRLPAHMQPPMSQQQAQQHPQTHSLQQPTAQPSAIVTQQSAQSNLIQAQQTRAAHQVPSGIHPVTASAVQHQPPPPPIRAQLTVSSGADMKLPVSVPR